MKRKMMAVAVGVASVFCALPASAQMMSQFYVGAGANRVDTDDKENGWKVFAGGQINPYVGFEAAYNDLGSFRGTDLTSWSLVGVGTVPLNPMWSAFAKAGVTSNRVENGVSEHNTEPLVGVGVGLRFNKNVGARVEYEDFGKTPVVAGSDKRISQWSLSLTYAF